MLHLYLDEVPKNKEEMFIYDVEGFFFTHKMKYSEIVKKAVQQIEQGQFLDLHQYQDRFGIRRSTFELSTVPCTVDECYCCNISFGSFGRIYYGSFHLFLLF